MNKEDKRLFTEAARYPLALRIAYKLHSKGYTRETLIQDKPHLSPYTTPLFDEVVGHLTNIQQGSLNPNELKRLAKLAENL